MKRQQIIPPNIDLVVNYPQSFLDLLNNDQWTRDRKRHLLGMAIRLPK